MNKLKEIWEKQLDFNNQVFKDKGFDINNLTEEELVFWSKEFCLHLYSEIGELLHEMPFKMHRKFDGDIIRSNISEELIDIFKFLVGLCNLWGINDEDFYKNFLNKTTVVEARYNQEKFINNIDSNKKIAVIDIDGVIADWPDFFIKWINEYSNIMSNYGMLDNVSINEKIIDFNDFLNLDLEVQLILKDRYRQSGVKAEMDFVPGAKEFLQYLYKKDYITVLITARPYHKYSRIYSDTLKWITSNNLPIDMIFWDEKKEHRIIKDLKNVSFVVEDDADNAIKIAKSMPVDVYLKITPYNNMYIERIKKIDTIIPFFTFDTIMSNL